MRKLKMYTVKGEEDNTHTWPIWLNVKYLNSKAIEKQGNIRQIFYRRI